MVSHPRLCSHLAGVVSVRCVLQKRQLEKCDHVGNKPFQLWNVNTGAVLLAWQAADKAIVAAGFVSPGRIVVVSSDAIIR